MECGFSSLYSIRNRKKRNPPKTVTSETKRDVRKQVRRWRRRIPCLITKFEKFSLHFHNTIYLTSIFIYLNSQKSINSTGQIPTRNDFWSKFLKGNWRVKISSLTQTKHHIYPFSVIKCVIFQFISIIHWKKNVSWPPAYL